MSNEAPYFGEIGTGAGPWLCTCIRCENCRKPMCEHDKLAHCWPVGRIVGAVPARRRSPEVEAEFTSVDELIAAFKASLSGSFRAPDTEAENES